MEKTQPGRWQFRVEDAPGHIVAAPRKGGDLEVDRMHYWYWYEMLVLLY